jgi:hypothetical protein
MRCGFELQGQQTYNAEQAIRRYHFIKSNQLVPYYRPRQGAI